MSRPKVTFDENGELEPTVENSDALAEGVRQALDRRRRHFWTGTFTVAVVLSIAVALVAQMLTRYTGWAAIALGLLATIFYICGAATGFSVSEEAVKVTYEPVQKS